MTIELDKYARRIYSQNGEDGILIEIFKRIGITNRFCVDLGAFNGVQSSNVAAFLDEGWNGILIDGSAKGENPNKPVFNHFITAENVNDILLRYHCPKQFDLLSIDINGNDYWVWKALQYRPRVVVIEYNGHIDPRISSAIEYEPNFIYRDDDYFSASLLAMKKLGDEKDYRLIYCDVNGVNAIFVDLEYSDHFKKHTVKELWRPLSFGPYPKSKLEMMHV